MLLSVKIRIKMLDSHFTRITKLKNNLCIKMISYFKIPAHMEERSVSVYVCVHD